MNEVLIWKFGGSSVAKSERIQAIIEIVQSATPKPRAIVFSAFGGVTDLLLELRDAACENGLRHIAIIDEIKNRHREAGEELIESGDTLKKLLLSIDREIHELSELTKGVTLTKDITPKTSDLILSFGERLSCLVISEAFKANGIDAALLDARSVITTDKNFGSAKVDKPQTYKNIGEYLSTHSSLQCVTGFIGASSDGETTTLGRGGSDYTASLFAAAIKSSRLEIWTDVDGVMTADPRKVENAILVPKATYREAMELSHFGAKVLYPPTIQPVREENIPLVVRNTFKPECSGTLITAEISEREHPLTALSSINGISVLTLCGSGLVGVPGSSERLFGALARESINVILISQASSELSICFAIREEDSEKAEKAINEEFAYEQQLGRIDPIVIEGERTIISVIGEEMRELPGAAASICSALADAKISINAIAQGSSEENISLIVKSSEEERALRAIHRNCFESTRIASLFLLGPGQVGKSLLKICSDNYEKLRSKDGYQLKLAGVARSKGIRMSESGIPWNSWEENWESEAITFSSVDELSEFIQNSDTPNPIVIDCTASGELEPLYQEILRAGIPMVSANKKVQSSKNAVFQTLIEETQKMKTTWRYETSVGAALPVIGTLEDLISSGDTIHRIEAILSGSLSYLFYRLQGGVPFSEAVKEAGEGGYLEPDPRDDLDGTDFARKLLILARIMGRDIELEDIEIEPLLSKELLGASSIEEFYSLLPSINDEYAKRISDAATNESRLRYVGVITDEKVGVSLQSVNSDSPLHGLSETDNQISFFTERYSKQPLVIQGAGAGPEITASGVYTDIIKTIKTERGGTL